LREKRPSDPAIIGELLIIKDFGGVRGAVGRRWNGRAAPLIVLVMAGFGDQLNEGLYSDSGITGSDPGVNTWCCGPGSVKIVVIIATMTRLLVPMVNFNSGRFRIKHVAPSS
jgi:hypothetical protein